MLTANGKPHLLDDFVSEVGQSNTHIQGIVEGHRW